MLTRRGLLGAIICAPAIVRASSLMKLPRPDNTQAILDLLKIRMGEAHHAMIREIEHNIFYGENMTFKKYSGYEWLEIREGYVIDQKESA